MKRKIAWMLLTLSLFAMLAGTSVYAQSSAKTTANIPFDFQVGSQSLPAGEYTLVPRNVGPSMVLIRSKDGHESAMVLTQAVQVNQNPAVGKLVFNRYGALYFLSQIWTPGREVGRNLPNSKTEQELAGGNSPPETIIVLTAHKSKS